MPLAKLVYLFFIISAFSMCCGYYEKVKNNAIDMNRFYSRRYERILPFFALLVLMDLAVSLVFNGGIEISGIYEAFADVTLMFGFLPASNITVIGVGWTLGVIFGFYIIFPFFVFLIWNKKRAWFSLAVTLGLHFVCKVYFLSEGEVVRCNAVRWLCYFVAGGLIYLYRDKIGKLMKNTLIGVMMMIIGFTIVFFWESPMEGICEEIITVLKNMIGYVMMFSGFLCPDIKLWHNPVSKYISGVSLEIYLAHMMIFRVVEKLKLTTVAGEGIVSYIFVCVLVIGGTLVFATVYKYIEKAVKKRIAVKAA